MEAGFQFCGVIKQRMMFRHVIAALPSNITPLVSDIIGDAQEDTCYDLLKSAVISRLSVSQEKPLHELFALVEFGDRSPSQLLHHMRSLASGCELDDEILIKYPF
nr:gag pol polyprotein [Hymenolepis microstoma]